MRRYALGMIVLLAGCGPSAVERRTSGTNFTAERVGEIDGCAVWRWNDFYTYYAVICPSGNARVRATYQRPKQAAAVAETITTRQP